VLRGAELAQAYARVGGKLAQVGPPQRLVAGQVTAVSPTIGDLHSVANADPGHPSVSIHVYGGNIGRIRRTAYDAAGRPKRFVSGYSNDVLPNPWRDA
jgi:predicted metal-dependent enzyme (double-stranded beta helix superfamily)